jgi:hypothetical protein
MASEYEGALHGVAGGRTGSQSARIIRRASKICRGLRRVFDEEWFPGSQPAAEPLGIFRPVHLVTTGLVRVEPFGAHAWNDETATRDAAVAHVQTELRDHDIATRTVTLETRVHDRRGRTGARPLRVGSFFISAARFLADRVK